MFPNTDFHYRLKKNNNSQIIIKALSNHLLHELKRETEGDTPSFAQFLYLFPSFVFSASLLKHRHQELCHKFCQNLLYGWLQVQHSCLFLLAINNSEKVKNKTSEHSVALSLLAMLPQVECKLSRSFRNTFSAISSSDIQSQIMRAHF